MKHEYKLKIICDQQHFQNNMQTKHEFILLSVLPYDFEKKNSHSKNYVRFGTCTYLSRINNTKQDI